MVFRVCCLLLLCFSSFVNTRRPPPPPLQAEDVRTSLKSAECRMGNQMRELGSEWSLDLGPPFHVNHCVRCSCVREQKKRKSIGRVLCRNIKRECPETTCDDAIVLPGQCCKTCPHDLTDFNLIQDAVSLPTEEEDKNSKHYATILSRDGQSATARFTFTKKSLSYSLYVTSRPQLVQFLDQTGNILEEQELGNGSAYENSTNKVCGIWRRLPRDYRKLLREEQLSLSLVWSTMAITGRILRYTVVGTEQHSALLTGPKFGSVGTAIVSVSTSVPAIHMDLIFTGVFTASDTLDAPVILTLHTQDGRDIIHETIRVDKASPDLNRVETSSLVSIQDLRLLARSKLHIKLISKNSLIQITGSVGPKLSCELFCGLLTTGTQGVPAGGLALSYLDQTGDLVYRAYFHGISTPHSITFLGSGGDKSLDEVPVGGSPLVGVAPRLLAALHSAQLAVRSGGLEGRLLPRSASFPKDSLSPLLLSPTGLSSLVGFIWLAVDSECSLYYELEVSEPGDYGLWLVHVPIAAPNAPTHTRQVSWGRGARMEGLLLGLSNDELILFNHGVVTVQLRHNNTGEVLLRANWEKRDIPRSCLPQSISGESSYISDGVALPSIISAPTCYHSNMFHGDGEQWRDPKNPCTVCSCHLGSTSCHTQCINTTEDDRASEAGRRCQMAGESYPPGASWHPYLHPSGFDTCTLCSCHGETLKVSCTTTKCPCDERTASRADKRACCSTCPSQTQHISNSQDGKEIEAGDEVLSSGGCTRSSLGGPYKNGEQWHPRLLSVGEVKCILCLCQDGKITCERKQCIKTTCPDECCASQCKRRRRYAKKHHRG